MTTNKNRIVLLLRTPYKNDKKEEASDQFFSHLAEILKGRKETISGELVVYDKFLWFFITCPSYLGNIIRGQLNSYYPEVEIEEVKDYTEKIFFNSRYKYFAGCEIGYEQPDLLPFKTYKELNKNPLVSLSGIASSFKSEEIAFIQLVFIPPKREGFLDKIWKHIKKRKQTEPVIDSSEKKENYIELERRKEEASYFKGTIRFLVGGSDLERAKLNLFSMISIYKKALERPKIQKLKEDKISAGYNIKDNRFLQAYKARILGSKKIRLSTEEIATFFHLPYQEEEISQIVQVRSKKAPPPYNLPKLGESEEVAIFGETNYQNERITFGIKQRDRRHHLYIIGKTGVGKSKLIELLVQSDLKVGNGVILLDPHGDLAQETLALVPKERIEDVVYFDPTDADYPIGFNPMFGVSRFEFKQNIAAGFISIFKKIFGLNWNERFEHVLRYTVLALLDYPASNILGIPRMLTDNLFRQSVIRYIGDPLVKKFWTTEFMTWNEQYANEAIVPIINRVGQFISNPLIRNIIGQSQSTFSFEEIINGGKIFIANLSIGKLGEENVELLGSMFVTKIWETVMARASIPEEKRKDVFFYIDEFQNFATTTFANILSEARKYHLSLIFAHQYMQQLTDQIAAAVIGNVGNIISFRVGGDDAQILSKEFEPLFTPNDFINLGIRDFYIKMLIDGQTCIPFSGHTITLVKPADDYSQQIIENSRKKWGRKREVVEEEIKRWEEGEIKIETQEGANLVEEIFPEPII